MVWPFIKYLRIGKIAVLLTFASFIECHFFLFFRLRSSLWLQFKPNHIAAGAAYLAAKFLNWDLAAYQNIWHEFQTTPAILQGIPSHANPLPHPQKIHTHTHTNQMTWMVFTINCKHDKLLISSKSSYEISIKLNFVLGFFFFF